LLQFHYRTFDTTTNESAPDYNIGILKDEFYLGQTFDSVTHAKRAAKNAINLYNEIRLHLSLDYKHQIWYINYQLNSILTCSHISGQDI
jgi:hypothetical protein